MSVLNLVERIAREELIELLGDVEPPSPPPPAVPPSEERVAALFAAEFGGECWGTFAAGIVDPGFAGRSLDLYRFTTPWLPEDEESPVTAAAELLRQIGDGYAMLSHPLEQSPLPLPLKVFAEVVIRAFGIDAWAAAHGHPLTLDVAEADYQLEHHQNPGTDDRDPDADLDGALEIARRRYELLEVLCDSATGRTALQSEAFQVFAVERLVVGHDWSLWVRTMVEGKAAQQLVRMAQGWFIAAHGGVSSSRDLYVG